MKLAQAFRDEFPVTGKRTYLISASLGPLSRRSRALAEEHLDLWERLGPEDLWFEHGLPRLEECRSSFARLIRADPGEVAVVPSVSAGLSSIASCLDFRARPKVVLSALDFPTNHYVWLAQRRRGARLDVAPSRDGIGVEAGELIDRIDGSTAVVNLNRVLYESSWIMDVPPIVEAAHREGALVVLDDFHGTGTVPIDVYRLGVDVLLSGALKWLCGGQGIAFLYVRESLIESLEPTVVGWFGTQEPFRFGPSELRLRSDARRFETGTYGLPQAWTASGGLGLILEAGVDSIRAHSRTLTEEVIRRADGLGLELQSPREPDRRAGLVRLRMPGGSAGAQRILHALLRRDVVLDARGDALRISPHFFNDAGDIGRCFTELRAVL